MLNIKSCIIFWFLNLCYTLFISSNYKFTINKKKNLTTIIYNMTMFPKMFQTRVPTLILFPACVNFFVAKWYSPWCMQTSAMASRILTRSIVSIPASSLLGVSFSAKSSLISTVWSMQIFKASQYCNQKSKTMSSSSKFYCISICIAYSATQNPTILDKILYWSWNFLSVTLPWQNGSWKLNCNFWKFCFLIHSILMFVKKYKYNIHIHMNWHNIIK